MIAVILAAGVGQRMKSSNGRPKILLEFAGRTLLERHVSALIANGIQKISISIGYNGDLIRREVNRLGANDLISFIENPRFLEGSVVSLWAQRDLLKSEGPVVLMDGDVLYDPRMIGRLIDVSLENTLLFDREIEPGDEPVKLCFSGDQIVDFHKIPQRTHDWHGESVGFFKFSHEMAGFLAERTAAYADGGSTRHEYEVAIRDLLLKYPRRFSPVDISDLPWIEIDFDSDVDRARKEILPKLEI